MVNIAKLVRRKLGELLMDEGLVREEQIQEALQKQKQTGQLLGAVLTQLGYVTEEDIARAMCKQFGLPYLDATRYRINRELRALVPVRWMHDHQFVVLDKIGPGLLVAVSGVPDAKILEELERQTGAQLSVFVSTPSSVASVLKTHYPLEARGVTQIRKAPT
jgi:hypothetical protein